MKLRDKPVRLTRLVTCQAGIATFGLLFGLFPSLTMAQEDTVTIRISVVDADFGNPVLSKIVTFPPEDGYERGGTDDEGQYPLRVVCTDGMKIQAQPVYDDHHHSNLVYCEDRTNIDFKVTAIKIASILQRNLDLAEKAHDWGAAALAANELSWINLRSGDGVAGAEAERLAYVYSARALGVAESFVFDPMQDKIVMAPNLHAAVSDFQRVRSIEVNGKLNYTTLYNMSGRTSGALRHYDVSLVER